MAGVRRAGSLKVLERMARSSGGRGEPGGAGPGQEVAALGVGRRAEPCSVAGVQQHGPTADVERRQGPDVDTAPVRSGHPGHHCRQVDGLGQRDGTEVRAVGVPVIGRVEIGPGVADHGQPVERELGARSVLHPRGFPGQVESDFRTGKPRIGDHPGPDHMAELDQPTAHGQLTATVIRWPCPRSLVRFGEDLDVAELHRVGHQQAERGHEQRGNLVLAGVGRGNIDAEPVGGQVTAAAEPDRGVERCTVFRHQDYPIT